MIRDLHLRTITFGLTLLVWLTPSAFADNGIVVSGQVIGIDAINQIMRVHVTGVNGFVLNGSPQTNYVDYLVSPNTVVVGPNNQFVNQSNVLVGSQIQMQFAGAYASAIVLVGNGNFTNLTTYTGGYVTPATAYRNNNNSVSQSQNFGPVTTYPSIVFRPRTQNKVGLNQHVIHNRRSQHAGAQQTGTGQTHVPSTTTTTTNTQNR
jgi:hypothetical protein